MLQLGQNAQRQSFSWARSGAAHDGNEDRLHKKAAANEDSGRINRSIHFMRAERWQNHSPSSRRLIRSSIAVVTN